MTGAVTYTLPPLRVAPTAAGDNDLDHGATTAVATLSDGLNRLRNVAIDRVMICARTPVLCLEMIRILTPGPSYGELEREMARGWTFG